MTFFVDANVVLYSALPSEYREPCLEIIEAVARGEADGRTSPAVLEEVWRVELTRRAGRIDGLTERAYVALAPLLPITDEVFRRALSLDVSGLETNDRIHAATSLAHGIEVIVSADAAFDRVPALRRVDPLDARARGRLLRAER